MTLKFSIPTILSLLLLSGGTISAQIIDSVEVIQKIPTPDSSAVALDTTGVADTILPSDAKLIARITRPIKRFFVADYPNPRKAALFGLVIPGAGQAYNKKWWKIPIVYAALGGVGYVEYNNINQYRYLRNNYRWLVDEQQATVVDPALSRVDARTLKAARDGARQNLEYSSLALGFTVLLSVADAFVDAHMATFDVSDDLSLQFCPKIESTAAFGPAFGIGVSFNIHP
jgi:hypothetical protein